MNDQNLSQLLKDVQALLGRGELERAEQAARDAIRKFPFASEAHNALGVIYRTKNDFVGAAASYRAALEADPANGRAYNNLGEVYLRQNRLDDAVACFNDAVSQISDYTQAYRGMADALVKLGRGAEAQDVLKRAILCCADDPILHYELAVLDHDTGRFAQAIAGYARYLDADPSNVSARVNYASALLDANLAAQALDSFCQVLKQEPENTAAQFGYHEAISCLVPPWHVPMMNENKRNFAYRDALRAIVRPSDHVLEIGTGAGLLSLLAAEAGARTVTTCEMVSVVAEEATRIVAHNGYASRIKVLAKKSTDIQLGLDMHEQADVLVSEILANDFVGEGVLPSLCDAKARLLKPGARIIPAAGAMMGVLVGGEEIRSLLDLDRVCGFDMHSFARFKPWRQAIPQPVNYEALSDDVALLRYDFNDEQTLKFANGMIEVEARRAGRCYGLLQWIRIELAPGIVYDNHPQTTQSVWNKVLYAFPVSFDVVPGDNVQIKMWQSAHHFYLSGAKCSSP